MPVLSKKLVEALNEQMKHEIESAYLYLAMSAYCESINLPGTGHWLRVQWQEEVSHGMKLFSYIIARGGRVVLKSVDEPPASFGSVTQIFEKILAHEEKVTGMINRLYELAIKENDYATQVELQWFIKEQVEEERAATEILLQLKAVGDSGISMLMLDRQLGARAGSGK